MEVRDRITESERLLRTGRYAEAIDLLNSVLADDPTDLHAMLNVGIAYTEHGENDKAIKALDCYVSREKETAEAWEALGCAYLRKREYDEAEEHLRRARSYAPRNASVLRNLSVLLSRTGRGSEAFQLLKEAHELDGSDYLTTFALASTYRAMGDRDNARTHFEELLSFFPALPEAVRQESEQHLLELTVGW